MLHIQESANLFEVVIPDYKQMKQCRKEIKLLKGIWDIHVNVTVRFLFVFQRTIAQLTVTLIIKGILEDWNLRPFVALY